MRKLLYPAAAVLLFVQGARGDDPPAPPKPPAPPAAPVAPVAPARHENKISAEAKEAFEKMKKLAGGPVSKGLKDASGTIEMEMRGMNLSMKFTFQAPAAFTVEPDPNVQGPAAMMSKGMAKSFEGLLRMAFGVFTPAEDAEYDADYAKKDGKEVVTLTNYKDGVETSKTEFTLDANGLPATGILTSKETAGMGGRPGMKRGGDGKAELTYAWVKSGDTYHAEKITTAVGQYTQNATFTYADVGGYSMPVSIKSESPIGASEIKINLQTVDGKKCEAKAPEPAPAPVKPEGGDKK